MTLAKMAVSPEQHHKSIAANGSVEELFALADLLLFKEKKYLEAEGLYREIIAGEGRKTSADRNERNCVDALISIGYCIKFRTTLLDLLEDWVVSGVAEETKEAGGGAGVFSYLVKIYQQALEYD